MAANVWSEVTTILRNQLQIYGYSGYMLPYYSQKVQLLENMIQRTAVMGESNSVLIIGPRGSGKTSILECVMEKTFGNKLIRDNLLYVALDGLIHTNDDIAFEDIARQLRVQETEDKPMGSSSEKLRLLLSALKSGSKESKSILFVLDNFDLICKHKNQTLLYNLFDVAQSQQSPICIVCMSCHSDVLHVLDDRVNSRFSQQTILLYEKMTFSEYMDAAKHFLTLHKFSNSKVSKKWNAEVDNILKQKEVKNILETFFYKNNSLRGLKEFLFLVILGIGESHSKLVVEDFQEAFNCVSENSNCAIIQDLSVLELSLVIAMMHLTEIYEGEPFNFEIVYNELSKYFRKKMAHWNIDKSVTMKAFEHLIDLELVRTCSDSSNTPKRFMLVRLLATTNEVKEAIESYQNIPLPLKQWSESSLDG